MLKGESSALVRVNWPLCIAEGVSVCAISSAVVFAGILFGGEFLTLRHHHFQDTCRDVFDERPSGMLGAIVAWDVVWYADIMRHGYSNDADARANIVFFPAFPACGLLVSRCTGLTEVTSLAVTANICFCASL